uniref:RNA polymerase sigma factor n=1 Tax=Oceanobacillus massiliensis TaxID=1465765 RepID=UPI003016CBEF
MIELVRQAQGGSGEAFLKLFQSYENRMYCIAYVYVKNKDDALDVMQETAYRSLKNLHSLRN